MTTASIVQKALSFVYSFIVSSLGHHSSHAWSMGFFHILLGKQTHQPKHALRDPIVDFYETTQFTHNSPKWGGRGVWSKQRNVGTLATRNVHMDKLKE